MYLIRGRQRWKFGRYQVPIGTQKIFSGRYLSEPTIFNLASTRPVSRYPVPRINLSQKQNKNYNVESFDSKPGVKFKHAISQFSKKSYFNTFFNTYFCIQHVLIENTEIRYFYFFNFESSWQVIASPEHVLNQKTIAANFRN